jgi:hypothetical protein
MYGEGVVVVVVVVGTRGTATSSKLKPLTSELNPSSQRRLNRFFTGDFVS